MKLLNNKGEFLTAEDGAELLKIADKGDFTYADVDHLGHYREDDSFDQHPHRQRVGIELVDADAIRKAGFKVVVRYGKTAWEVLFAQNCLTNWA